MNKVPDFLTAEQISEAVGGIVHGDAKRKLFRLAFPRNAAPDSLVICLEDMNRERAIRSEAGAILLPLTLALPPHRTFIVTTMNLREALSRVIRLFADNGVLSNFPEEEPFLHETVIIGENVTIGKGASIGAHTVLENHAVIGQGVTIGTNCRIEASSILRDGVRVGNNVTIHSGAVIGGEGYMFSDEADAGLRIPSIGSVLIEDSAEIFENVTIARGILGDTVIGKGTKVDCQTHIGHDVIIGQHCRICAQCAIAGWAEIQNGVTLYGMCGVSNHVVIGKNATVYAFSVVTKDVSPLGKVSGNPATEHQEELKRNAFLRKLYKNRKG